MSTATEQFSETIRQLLNTERGKKWRKQYYCFYFNVLFEATVPLESDVYESVEMYL